MSRNVFRLVSIMVLSTGCSPVDGSSDSPQATTQGCTTDAGCPDGYICQGSQRCVPETQGDNNSTDPWGKDDSDRGGPDDEVNDPSQGPKQGLPCEIDTLVATLPSLP